MASNEHRNAKGNEMTTYIEINNGSGWEKFDLDFGSDLSTAAKYAESLKRGGCIEVRIVIK